MKLQLSPDLFSPKSEDKLKPKYISRNDEGAYDIGLGLALKAFGEVPPIPSTNVLNVYFSGDKVISRSDKNGMLLPLFPDPVESEFPDETLNQSSAFDAGRNGLRSVAWRKKGDDAPSFELLGSLMEPIETCLAAGANLTVDVYGFASYRWDSASNEAEKADLNHALSEGRRMALIDKLAAASANAKGRYVD